MDIFLNPGYHVFGLPGKIMRRCGGPKYNLHRWRLAVHEIQQRFFRRVDINPDVLEPLHSGIALFDHNAVLVYANSAYLKMYKLNKNSYIGIKATDLFLTATQGTLEVLKTGKANFCTSVTVDGLYGVTYRYPVRDRNGNIAGCMTENLSVAMDKQRIHEMQKIIQELQDGEDYSTITLARETPQPVTFDAIVGESAAMRQLKNKALRYAQHDEPILVQGENGTGKDMVAQALHMASPRKAKPFVSVNCAALPQDLMESELFGYEAGAFTGAKATGKKGKFELAEGGTIFLDEIGELPLKLQAKLLRVLENHELQKLGSPMQVYVDFRLVSATNRNLEQLVERGEFREDLFYRLNLFDLVVPPLRERLADIPLLAYSIIRSLLGVERAKGLRIAPEVLSVFSAHQWRGNVRELRNILTYAVYGMSPGETTLGLHNLPERFFSRRENEYLETTSFEMEMAAPSLRHGMADKPMILPTDKLQEEAARLAQALRQTGGNKARAARMLGMARSNFYKKLEKYGIGKARGAERG